MNLSEHIERVIKRATVFCASAEPGNFLVNTRVPAQAPPVPPLCGFDLDRQLHEWLDCLVASAEPAWRAKEGLDDDSIPSICPRFGIAEHSAWLGMDVRLQATTCLPVPLIGKYEDIERLKLSENTKWFRYMKSGYEYLRRKPDRLYALSVRGGMSPMDLANAVRGDDLFTDFLLEPRFCHTLLDFLVGAERWYYGNLRSWADEIAGGNVFQYGESWMPPGTIGHLSNDAAMLCSPDIYREFGFPYETRLVEGFGHVLYHVHNEKLHYIPQLAKLPNLSVLEVTHDPKTVPPIEDLPRILQATGSAGLMLRASGDQVRAHIDELKSRNVFLQVDCRDRSDAEDIVSLVRAKSKPL